MKLDGDILFFGPQGSGKGTQAKLLAKKWNLLHLSSGDTLRAIAKTATPLGRYLKKQLSGGSLTPIEKLMQAFEMRMKKGPSTQHVIFDGFARQITETRIFLRRLKKMDRRIAAAVLISITKSESIKRLSKRASCTTCSSIIILGGKVKVGGRCPSCGKGTIFQRSDDQPKAIERRLRIYQKRTLPVLKHFSKEGVLIKISGEQSIAKVHQDILKALNKKLS